MKKNTKRQKEAIKPRKAVVREDGSEILIDTECKIPNRTVDFFNEIYSKMKKGDSVMLDGWEKYRFMDIIRSGHGAGRLMSRNITLEYYEVDEHGWWDLSDKDDSVSDKYRVWKL